MPRMAFAAEALHLRFAERDFREHRHAVIALLPVDRLVDIAQLREGLAREQPVLDLGLLQRHDVGLMLAQEPRQQGRAQADGIDIPGGDLHGRSRSKGGARGDGSGAGKQEVAARVRLPVRTV